MAAAAVVLTLLGWGFYYVRAVQVARAGAERVREVNLPMRTAAAKFNKLRQRAGALDAVSAPLVAAINDRFFWTEILEDLSARLPKEDIWITELILTSGGKPVGVDQQTAAENPQIGAPPRPPAQGSAGTAVDGLRLRGLYLYNQKQQEIVVDYFKNLVGSPFFNVDPNNQSHSIKSTIPNNTEWAFPFELRLNLKKPMKIP
jgi:Tfp pilus assembly protein PilN